MKDIVNYIIKEIYTTQSASQREEKLLRILSDYIYRRMAEDQSLTTLIQEDSGPNKKEHIKKDLAMGECMNG